MRIEDHRKIAERDDSQQIVVFDQRQAADGALPHEPDGVHGVYYDIAQRRAGSGSRQRLAEMLINL